MKSTKLGSLNETTFPTGIGSTIKEPNSVASALKLELDVSFPGALFQVMSVSVQV